MYLMSNALIELLNEINDELTNQISLVKNADAKIDTRKLFQLSNTLNDLILTSEVAPS